MYSALRRTSQQWQQTLYGDPPRSACLVLAHTPGASRPVLPWLFEPDFIRRFLLPRVFLAAVTCKTCCRPVGRSVSVGTARAQRVLRRSRKVVHHPCDRGLVDHRAARGMATTQVKTETGSNSSSALSVLSAVQFSSM